MALVIVVDHPRYSEVYRRPPRYTVPGDPPDEGYDDRHTLLDGEGWAEFVDLNADGVATPQYLAEHSTNRRRPFAEAGNRVAHCVIPIAGGHWRLRNIHPSVPVRPANSPLTRDEYIASLPAQYANFLRLIHEPIANASVATYERAAQWSRPHGTVSILVGHGLSLLAQNGRPGTVQVDLAPAGAAVMRTALLEQLATEVRDLRRQGQSYRQVARQPGWNHLCRTVLQMGVAFRAAGVRRVDLLVCQTGVGPQGMAFLNLLARFWGCRVRGTRGTAAYWGDGAWDVTRPVLPSPPSATAPNQQPRYGNGGCLGTNLRGPNYLEGPIPGYPHDTMFRSSDGSGRRL